MTSPRVAPASAEAKPTSSAVRAPWMIREKISRPNSSVPSQCARFGGAIMCA